MVREEKDFVSQFEQARRESLTAFGSPDVFVEKFIAQASHIEVQLLGDKHGNLVHLWERDCSIQRRHQKVVEIAPAPQLDPKVRNALCDAAIAIGREVRYENAGTVEFLLDRDTNRYYFIEVNPRIQVEHTVTEEVTGVDIVKSQILIAEGTPLSDPEIGLSSQADIRTNGFAVQCRVTTEDPANNFMPDYGRVAHYRSASGMGIRLDAGSAFSGAVVNPFYDSLLVKVSARGRRFIDAARRMERCLQEFRIRGVKTNIPFLIKLITHPKFLSGTATTRFIDETPDLFALPKRRDRATKLLTYLGEVIVNGNPLVKDRPRATRREPAPVPAVDRYSPIPPGLRDKLRSLGAQRFCQWVLRERQLFVTDTTFRDAHQSLLATRVRSHDLLEIADAYARRCSNLFSLEMWGGATFDTAMRFLKECPWQRLADLRERIPNIPFQMLLRASNAVGYTNYPDNIVREFVKESAEAGIDLFRVFDALNWVPNMRVAMEAVLQTDGICEPAICYSGDILNPQRDKYTLKYYVELAKQLEKMGAHILAIKDMAGLCKPYAAERLVKALKEEIGIPIHFHTHDTAGIQAASLLKASDQGVDVIDAAMAPMSGGTSQPNLNTLVEAAKYTERDTGLHTPDLDAMANYWQAVREFYKPFDCEMVPATTDLYNHEMPGGQYTNLQQQANALGLGERWPEVCHAYAEVNDLFGDIVKVTPTSKAVGDMALFLVANNLSASDLLKGDREFAFPESVIDLIGGRTGFEPLAQTLGELFVREAFSPQAQAKANRMIEDVRAAMKTRIDGLPWMSPETKQRAQAKLAHMTAQIGGPEKWPDYSGLRLDPKDPAGNYLAVQAWGLGQRLAELPQPVDRSTWNTSPHIVNAFAAGLNRIVFPAGILQPPFFDEKAEDAVNYGAIGMVIGHEIIHHFDDRGRQYDEVGNLKDWWAPGDAAAYRSRADRVADFYSQYEPLPGLRINGRQMLGENISDLGGINIAFDALQLALKRQPAPVIDGRTPEQRFFVANAIVWRGKQRPQALEQQIRTGQHSPGPYRVRGPLSNMPAFAQAFGCKAGDPMVAENPVAVW